MFINPSDLHVFIITMIISLVCEFASILINKWRKQIQGDNIFNFALNIGLPLIFISSGIKSILNAIQTNNFIRIMLGGVSVLCFIAITLNNLTVYIKNKKRC